MREYLRFPCRPSSFPAASALSMAALVLTLGGCGGGATGDAGHVADSAVASQEKLFTLEDGACGLVTVATLATTFDVPADRIRQGGSSNICTYSWQADGQTLDVSVHLYRAADSAAKAAERFESSTRGLSGAELDSAMKAVGEEARRQGGLDTQAREAAAGALLGETAGAMAGGSGGLQFRDVDGIADQARILAGNGDVHVRHGNLYFSVGAYHGPQMPPPAQYTPEALLEASRAWQKSIVPEREQAGIALARAAVASLQD